MLDELKLQLDELIGELKRLPELGWKEIRDVGAKLLQVMVTVNAQYPIAKAKRKLLYAEKWVELRQDQELLQQLKERIGKNPTIDDIKALVESDPEYREAVEFEAELEGLVDVCKAVLKVLELISINRTAEYKYLLKGLDMDVPEGGDEGEEFPS